MCFLLFSAVFPAIMVREADAVASLFPAAVLLAIGTAMEYHAAAKQPPDDTEPNQYPHLCRRRRLPGEGRDLSRRGQARPARERGRGPVHPRAARPADRARRG